MSENPLKTIDSCMLFILKNNMGWKESIYREAIKEMQSIENKIIEMHEEFLKDMSVVNPIGILQSDDGNMDSKALTKRFNDAIMKIKDTDTPIASDFTMLANIESMLYLNRNVMPWQSLKIKEFKWQKDSCRSKLLSLKNPHSHAMQEFMNTFRSWKLVKKTMGKEEKPSDEP